MRFTLVCMCLASLAVGSAAAKDLASDVNTVLADLREAAAQDFSLYHNDIFPGFLFHTNGSTMHFFQELGQVLLEPPTHVAWSEGGQIRTAVRPARTGATLDEPWMIVWFHGSNRWSATRFARQPFNNHAEQDPQVGPIDVPWLMILQSPAVATLDEQGLHLQGDGALGYVVFMPLMGSEKLRPEQTAGWADGLPAEILEKARFWTRVSRQYPIYVREDYQVDQAADAVRIRNAFDYLPIEDTWKTEPLTLAPVAPVMALALTSGYHMSIDPAPQDLHHVTHWGPYWGVPGASEYTVTVHGVLKYIDEEAVVERFREDTPGFAEARQLLLGRMNTAAGGADPRGAYSIDWGMGMVGAWMRAMKLIPQDLQDRVTGYIRRENLLNGYFLNPETYQAHDVPISPRASVTVLAVRPREGLQTYADDLVKQTSRMPFVVWQYGYYSGDWETVRAKLDMVKQMYGFNLLLGWSNVGPEYTAEHAKISAKQGPIGLARLGRQFGEQDTYDYGAYLLAKAMINEWAWANAAVPYIQANQPWAFDVKDEMIQHQNHGYIGLSALPADEINTYSEIPLVLDRFNREELQEFNDFYIRMRHKYFPNEVFNNVYVSDLGNAESFEALLRKPLTDLLKPEILSRQSHVSPGYYNYPIDLMELTADMRYERIYPTTAEPAVWRRGLDSLSRGQSWRQLVIAIRADSRQTPWPYPCWYIMSPPKKAALFTNDALPFGLVSPGPDARVREQREVRSNWNSRLVTWDLE